MKKQSIAVLLDANAAGGVSTGEVTKLVSAAAGVDTKRGDVVKVSTLAFDTSAAAAAQAELDQAAAAKKRADMISLGKTVGLGLLLLLALLIGLRRSRRRSQEEPREIEVYRVEDTPVPPAPVDSVLEATEPAPALSAPRHAARSGESRSESRHAIGQMAKERPDDVARLLRGWIAEEK